MFSCQCLWNRDTGTLVKFMSHFWHNSANFTLQWHNTDYNINYVRPLFGGKKKLALQICINSYTLFSGLREGSVVGNAYRHSCSWRVRFITGSSCGFDLHFVRALQWFGLRHPVSTILLCYLPARHQYLRIFYGLHNGACVPRRGRRVNNWYACIH